MILKKLLNFFFRGLLFIFPVFATFAIVLLLIDWANDLFNRLLFNWLSVQIPGLGILTAITLITLLGFLVSRAFSRPLFSLMERLMARTPLIKILYNALRDLTAAFVSDKKKFNKPVLFTLAEGLDRIGFITEEDLSILSLENRVAVYCPHSYNFSGNLFLVSRDRIRPLVLPPADVMKFAVTAGVAHIESEE
ncbi:MAG: DUF502 domain-containing protein [Balneolaceae bacterium]